MKKVVKLLTIVIFLFAASTTLLSVYRTAVAYQPDFSIFYASAKDVVHSSSPFVDRHLYTALNYPIVTTVFFIPFTFFPFIPAQIIFTLFNSVALFLCISVACALLNKKVSISTYLFTASLTLLAFPTKFTFGMGQVNIIAYTALLLGFLLYTNKGQKSALVFLVIAMLLKPILGFTLIIFLFEKRLKYFFILLSIMVFLVVLFPIVLGQTSSNALLVSRILNQSLAGREVYYNQGLLGFISRITISLFLRGMLNAVGTIGFICIGFVKLRKASLVEKISLLLTILLLIDPLSWQHHFVFLLLPFLVIWFAIKKGKSSKFFLYALLIASYVLVAWNFKMPQDFKTFPLFFLLSNQFYGAFLLFVLQLILL